MEVLLHTCNVELQIEAKDRATATEALKASAKLPADQRDGFTSKDGTIEAWPIHLSLQCLTNPAAFSINEWQFRFAMRTTSVVESLTDPKAMSIT